MKTPPASKELQVEKTEGKGRGRKTWNECVKVDMKWFGLVKNDSRIEIGGGV